MSVLSLFWRQHMTRPPNPNASFSGQTVIVTGANSGLGFEAAKKIARAGVDKLIIAVRSTEKGEAAKASIEAATGSKSSIEVWPLDLQSHASVKAFAARAQDLPRLDVLLENAGIETTKFTLVEGDESTITTNVTSTLLLALLLLPKLKETATKFNTRPHISIVTSELHMFTSFPERKNARIFDSLADEKSARMNDRYQVSKLLEILAIRGLVAESAPAGYPVIMNLISPGFCRTALLRERGSIFKSILYTMMGAWSTEEGSRTLVSAAAHSEESHGQYLNACVVTPTSAWVRSKDGEQTQKRVWDELKAKLEKIQPGILGNI